MYRSLLIVLLISTLTCFASAQWSGTQFYDGSTQNVISADLDNDGDADIVSATDSDGMLWWENDGADEFIEHSIPTPLFARSLQAADMDGDGNIDLISSTDEGMLSWWENNDADFSTVHDFAISIDAINDLAIADVDSDGDIDIVAVGMDENFNDHIAWYENIGGNMLEHIIYTSNGPETIRNVQAADLDNDGDIDITDGSYAIVDELRWWENDGNENFAAQQIPGLTYPELIVDIDQDGDVDLIEGGAPAVCYLQTENGQFGDSFFIGWHSQAAAGDIDNDGDIDIAGRHHWFENDGLVNAWSMDLVVFPNQWVDDVSLADLNGDGFLDMITASLGEGISWWEYDPDPDPVPEQMVSAVSNFGNFGEPNFLQPSGEYPGGSDAYYLWEGRYWVAAKVDGDYQVSHADYGNYEWMPSPVAGIRPPMEAQTLGESQFQHLAEYDDLEDIPGHNPIGLEVEQVVTAFGNPIEPTRSQLIQQQLHNVSGETLDSVFVSWVFDFDIGANIDPSDPHYDDWCNYQADRELAYMWDGDYPEDPYDDTGEFGVVPGYAGIALLDAPLPASGFQWWNWEEDPGTDFEKFQFMAGIHPASDGQAFRAMPDTVFDYRVMLSTGPYTLSPGETIETAVTFSVGDGMQGLEDAVDEIAAWYAASAPELGAGPDRTVTFILDEPYPNPFNSQTQVQFELVDPSHVELSVYDVLGRHVSTLLRGMQSAGEHSATFNAADLSSGLYFITLTGPDGMQQTRKIILMK